jgi:transcriptional regulator with XRE-family HTH domain
MAREPFGTRLRSLRERAGMTQTQLAEKVGTDQSHISRWERNAAVPELAMVERLAATFGVSAGELLSGSPEKPAKAA